MNLLSMVGASTLAPPEHPWPEFDLFDNLSSPPSWVSEANTNSTTALPIPQAEQALPSRPFDFPDVSSNSIPDPAAAVSLPHFQQRNFRQQQPSLAQDLGIPPVPSADLVDSALEFVAPTSPVHSELPTSTLSVLSGVSQPELPQPSITALNTPTLPTPLPSQKLPDQPVMPAPHVFPIMQNISAPSIPVIAATTVDSNTSQATTSSNRSALSVPKQLPVAKAKGEPSLMKTRTSKGKQTRRYSAPKSSRYCHLCARHQRCVPMVPCGNVELGLCQKSVCQKCIEAYNLDVPGPSWACPHCQNNCPKRAKCFAYDRQTARRREKTLRAKMSQMGAAVGSPANIANSMAKP